MNEKEILSYLHQVDEYEFEELVADILAEWGWETEVTSKSQDRGVDVSIEKEKPFHQRYDVQVKQYSQGNKIGRPEIQKYGGVTQQKSNINGMVVATTSAFSTQAESASMDLPVELIDCDDLLELCSEINIDRILGQYLDLKDLKSNKTIEDEYWLGPNIHRHSSIDNAVYIVQASEMISEKYGEFIEGPAVVNKENSCPECTETLYGGEMEYEGTLIKCKFCIDCRTAFFKKDDSWVSVDY